MPINPTLDRARVYIGPHNRYNQQILPNSTFRGLLAMPSCLNLLLQSRIVAIIRLDRLERAEDLVRALLDGGIRCIEFTLTNPDTPKWVERLLSEEPRFRSGEACLGSGSVRNAGEAAIALNAGSQFLVTPIAAIEVVEACRSVGVPIAAGAYTPTEIESIWDAGADLVKVFPARSLGPSYIRDVLGPMPYLKLIPTGGIDASNAREYLDAGAVAIGVGGSLCRADWVDSGRWDLVRQAATQLVRSIAAQDHE
jgi:2-dehydro-3-deoxyphosphogluconate aldolase/(4S)-4-hydroxy-2-oxoglutarate aldolase